MGSIALLIRIGLAATFFIAGVAKVANLQKTQTTVREFGVPEWATKGVGIILPAAEVGTAILLLMISTVFWGGLAAIALLFLFMVGIVANLTKGRRPQCNCFGQLHSEPIGWQTLVRNGVLASGAVFVLWDARVNGSQGVVNWTRDLTPAGTMFLIFAVLIILAIITESWLCVHLLRQNGRLLLRMDALEAQVGNAEMPAPQSNASGGLALGSVAPDFALPSLAGGPITLSELCGKRRPLVLIFTDPACSPCAALLPDVARWQHEYSSDLTIALISRGTREANVSKLGESSVAHVLLQKEHEIASAYQVNGTPGAVLVDADGTIASPVVMGAQAIADLVVTNGRSFNRLSTDGSARRSPPAKPVIVPLRVGDTAPSIRLPDLDGHMMDLNKPSDRDTLVLFWNPNCGFCSKMLPDLQEWENRRESEAPGLLVISSGDAETNRAMGLGSPIILDQSFSHGSAFRIRGTPSAVLVDSNGRIASDVASGADAVFTLAQKRRYLVNS